MITVTTSPADGSASGAAAANRSPASWAGSASFAATWLDTVLAWQSAVWAANLEAMRLTQQAYRPDAWTQLGQQWVYMLHNGPIPS